MASNMYMYIYEWREKFSSQPMHLQWSSIFDEIKYITETIINNECLSGNGSLLTQQGKRNVVLNIICLIIISSMWNVIGRKLNVGESIIKAFLHSFHFNVCQIDNNIAYVSWRRVNLKYKHSPNMYWNIYAAHLNLWNCTYTMLSDGCSSNL